MCLGLARKPLLACRETLRGSFSYEMVDRTASYLLGTMGTRQPIKLQAEGGTQSTS